MILPLFEYSSNIILTISNLNDFIANIIYIVAKFQRDSHVQKARDEIVCKYFPIGEDHKIESNYSMEITSFLDKSTYGHSIL